MTGAHVGVVLFYFDYPFAGAGTLGCVVETADHGLGSFMQGLSC